MLTKKLDQLPGGRALIFLFPLLFVSMGSLFFSPSELTQIANSVVLALSIAMLWTYRKGLSVFMHETDAATLWYSLGTIVLVLTTIANVGRSMYFRAAGLDLVTDSYFLASVRVMYGFSFGCFFLAPLAQGSEIPPNGWLRLVSITFGASVSTVFLMWWF